MSAPMPGAIPWQLIIEYGLYHNYTGEEIELMDACMRAMDEVYITHHQRKMKESSGAQHS